MASSCSAYASSQETTDFARICRIVVDVLRDVLWQVLIHEVPPADLPNKVRTNQNKLGKLDVKINKWLCGISPSSPDIPKAENFDVTSLYTLIRNLCSQVQTPSTQWGKTPPTGGTTLGDDIERVREFRNTLYGHAKQAKIDIADFNNLCTYIKIVVSRFDVYFNSISQAMKCNFISEVDTILTCSMDKTLEDAYIDRMKENAVSSYDLGDVKQQVGDIKRQVDIVNLQVDDTKQQVDIVKQQVGDTKHQVDIVKQQVCDTKQQVVIVKQEVDIVNQQVGDTKQQVDFVSQQVGDIKKKVGIVDQQVGDIKQQVDFVSQQVGDTKQQVENLQSKVDVVIKECMETAKQRVNLRNCSCKTDADNSEQEETHNKIPDIVENGRIVGQEDLQTNEFELMIDGSNQAISLDKSPLQSSEVGVQMPSVEMEVVEGYNDPEADKQGLELTLNFKPEDIEKVWQSIEEVVLEHVHPKYLLDFFTKERILSADKCQDLLEMKRREMSRGLLQIVKDNLPNAFNVLLKALKTDGEDKVVHMLMKIIHGENVEAVTAPNKSCTANSTASKDLPGIVGATDGSVVKGAASTLPPGNSEIQKYLLTDAAQSILDMGYQPKLVLHAIKRVLMKKGSEDLTGQIIMEAVFEIEEEDKSQASTNSMEELPPNAVKNMRNNSFQRWPAELQRRPEEVAEYGFYYAGVSNCVRCFFCGVGLRHWMSEDDPWIVHARWSTECTYVRKIKGEEFVSLVKMAVEIAEREEAIRNDGGGNQALQNNNEAAPAVPAKEAPNKSGTANSTASKDLPGSMGATDGSVVKGAASTLPPGNSEIQKYLLTDAAQSVLDMGYQPKLVLHAIERVLMKKGKEDLTGQIIMEAVFEIEEEDKSQGRTQPISLQSAEGDKSTEKVNINSDAGNKQDGQQGHEASGNIQSEESQIDPEKIMKEHRELREATMCKICLENTISVVFLPCGHLVTCSVCAPAMRKCPVCRALIRGTVRTFYG